MRESRHAFTLTVLIHAPASPGTYTLWHHEALIYAGRASLPHTILERLMDHYCGRAVPCRATHCGWEAEEAVYAEAG